MSGFDEGLVTWSEQGLAESSGSSAQHAEKRLSEFIRQFQVGEEFVYRDQLRKNTTMGEYKLDVALEDVMKFDPKLSDGIRERYTSARIQYRAEVCSAPFPKQDHADLHSTA